MLQCSPKWIDGEMRFSHIYRMNIRVAASCMDVIKLTRDIEKSGDVVEWAKNLLFFFSIFHAALIVAIGIVWSEIFFPPEKSLNTFSTHNTARKMQIDFDKQHVSDIKYLSVAAIFLCDFSSLFFRFDGSKRNKVECGIAEREIIWEENSSDFPANWSYRFIQRAWWYLEEKISSYNTFFATVSVNRDKVVALIFFVVAWLLNILLWHVKMPLWYHAGKN